MIGQKELQNKLFAQIESDRLSKFIILVGATGSGRKTLSHLLAKQLGATAIDVDNKVDSIRNMIELAYTVSSPTMYIIDNGDEMSEGAKNAMLKVTEEPPQNSYFVLILNNEANTLNTIKSRGAIYYMDTYSQAEIEDMCEPFIDGTSTSEKLGIVTSMADSYREVELLYKYNPIEFMDYVKLVIDNIAVVSGANSFKIADKIALTSANEDKYDLKLFWKAFVGQCASRLSENISEYSAGIIITGKYIKELRTKSINKQMLFDMWLLDIRKEWMEYADS